MKKAPAAAIAVVGALALVGLQAAPATAEDQRPCVSKVEYMGLHIDPRAVVEQRWEVKPRGVVRVPDLGRVVIYKRCGYNIRHAWYGVAYQHGTAFAVTAWNDHLTKPDAPL